METATPSKPVKRQAKEILPDAEKIDQPSDINLGMGFTPFERPTPSEVLIEKSPLRMDYADELKFNEEPVKIMAHASADPNAPLYVEAWVNGKGVEQWIENIGWVEVKFIPVSQPVIVKRKYLEVWLRGRAVNVVTVQDKADGSEPQNLLRRTVTGSHTISILEDKNPRGGEWAHRLMRMTAST
jgi:hypothetical protein